MQSNEEQQDIQKQVFLQVNRYEVQQNAVFLNYQSDSLAQSIKNYRSLKHQERLSLIKNIYTIQTILNHHKEHFYSLLQQASNDCQEIQIQLLQFLQKVIDQLILQQSTPLDNNNYQPSTLIETQQVKVSKQAVQHYQQKGPSLKMHLEKQLINPLINLIRGTQLEVILKQLQVKEEACKQMGRFLCFQQSNNYQKSILDLAIELSRSDNEQNKIVSVQLLNKVLPILTSTAAIQNLFQKEYLRLYEESTVRVKKQVIHELSGISKVSALSYFEDVILHKFYFLKCKENVWGIRKACVEILPQLITLTENKKEELVALLLNFHKDGNKVVRVTAYRITPQFIAKYGRKSVPQKLLTIYTKLIDNEINEQVSSPTEIIEKVSYYFVGVLMTVGREKWKELKKLFDRLMKSKDEDVKMPIASSLHEIAKIIGPQESKDQIFNALDLILKENSDKLKLAAIAHLSQFVQLFDTNTRENLIDVFIVLQKDPKKWRVRHSISTQLHHLSRIYPPEIVFKYIFPIALKLCNDNVAQVRIQACNNIMSVVSHLGTQEDYQTMVIESIKGYGMSQNSIQRQTFIKICRNIFKFTKNLQQLKRKRFENDFMDIMMKLSEDPIINVRIALSVIVNQMIKQDKQRIKEMLKELILKLKQNQEVASYLDQLQ